MVVHSPHPPREVSIRMGNARVPLSPAALAVSIGVHAAAVLGAAAFLGWSDDDTALAGRGSPGILWVSLIHEGASSRSDDPRARERPAAAAPSEPAPPAANRRPPAARPLVTPPPRSFTPTRVAVVPTPSLSTPGLQTEERSRLSAAGSPPSVAERAAAAARLARVSPVSAAPHASAGSGERGGARPDWPGPDAVDRVARPRGPIRPDYPPRARRSGKQSTVVVEAWVDEAGAVAFASVVRSGGREFDESARRAVRRSAFRPARLAGEDVASRVSLRIHFQLYD